MNSLETRVHGLEMALDEISYDLAVSRGRIPHTDATEDMCCKLSGSEFLSSKFWKKTDGRNSTSRIYSRNTLSATGDVAEKHGSYERFNTNNTRFQHRRSELFMNPLADVGSDSKGHLGLHSCKIPKNVVKEAEPERTQSNNTSGQNGFSPAASAVTRKHNCW